MSGVSVSAPGKVVLSGEYAVLDGAPAICMALNRRARVTATQVEQAYHSVTAPGYSTARGRFCVTGERFDWLEAGDEFALLEHVWLTVNPPLTGALALSLDTRAFVDTATGRKTGIGSSAALTVALTAALYSAAGVAADVAAIATTAAAAHRQFQGGAGSGVDIACSAAGGIIEFRINSDALKPLHWPDGLAYALLWSGTASSTGVKLDQLGGQAPRPSRAALAVAAERMAATWASASPAAIVDEMRAYSDALRRFSVDHDLGIFDAGHAELADAAAGDVVYKPCGAGGGDVGIVLASSEEAVASFIDATAASNFERLDVSMELRGVQTGREEY